MVHVLNNQPTRQSPAIHAILECSEGVSSTGVLRQFITAPTLAINKKDVQSFILIRSMWTRGPKYQNGDETIKLRYGDEKSMKTGWKHSPHTDADCPVANKKTQNIFRGPLCKEISGISSQTVCMNRGLQMASLRLRFLIGC